ncbi:MAG: hypothetical protein KF708_07980 [Pirellulales bacterium]|nr:hypothetical protein [Pirellulales bacterium]
METIHEYTREEAINDGVLVRLCPELTREAGIHVEVAVTRSVFEQCIAEPAACPWQDVKGRAWDVLSMLAHAARQSAPGTTTIKFTVLVQNDDLGPKSFVLRADTGPGDHGEQVITILHDDEAEGKRALLRAITAPGVGGRQFIPIRLPDED